MATVFASMCLEESAHARDSQIGPTKPQVVFAVNGGVRQHELASAGIIDALTVHHHELTPGDMVSPVGECLNDVVAASSSSGGGQHHARVIVVLLEGTYESWLHRGIDVGHSTSGG